MNIIKSLSFLLLLAINVNANANSSDVTISCPSDVWLSCGAEIWGLSAYGNAYYYVNGQQYNAGQASVNYDLTNCQTGKIYRTWSVEDYNWNIISCTQTIYISGGYFNYSNIHWPETDLQLYGCNVSTHPDDLPEGYRKPEFDYVSCSMVGRSYKDQVFQFGPDCKKILRTWTVLDWCNYYPGSNNPGVWSFTQTIKVSNDANPELNCPADLEILPQNCEGAYVSLEDVLTDAVPCTGDYSISNNSIYADENGENASGFYPIGHTEVLYEMEYACGQITRCSQKIVVQEKAPVPYCLSELNIVLMPMDTDSDGLTDDGMVELWAKDLDYASFHPCYPDEILDFSFSSDTDSSAIVFTCSDVGLNELQLWVTDHNGNQAWCAVTVDVQNNAANIPDCQPSGNRTAVEGIVTDAHEAPLSNVFIELKSRAYLTNTTVWDTVWQQVVVDSTTTAAGLILYFYDYVETYVPRTVNALIPGVRINFNSDVDGVFISPELDPQRNYRLTAYRYPDNSVIDSDDVQILKNYLNGTLETESADFYLAADINEDRSVDLDDLYLLEAIAQGEEDEWPKERQWVFYDKQKLSEMDSLDNALVSEAVQEIMIEQNLQRFETMALMGVQKGNLTDYASAKTDVETDRRARDLDIRVYPNPFLTDLTISNPTGSSITVTVQNAEGKLMYNKTSTETSMNINETLAWPQGNYFYKIIYSDQAISGKLIKM